jgi:hypothetical protein
MSEDAAKIPTTPFEFALWALILRQEAESDPNLTELMRAAILGQFDILTRAIVTLDNLCAASLSPTEAGRAGQAIAEGLYAAITIGAYHPDAPRTPPTRAANKKRMRATHDGRRGKDVQEIIVRHARQLWDCKKSFKGNAEGTAKKIYDAVTDEIAKLPKVPKQWQLTKPQTEAAKEKTIRTIAARIRGTTGD